jgi:fucose 4-O-acetylase-like acetyltransferase
MQRIYYFDSLKGYLIILVVMGHTFNCFPCAESNWLYQLIYAFHMPLFLFISAFLYNRGTYVPGLALRRVRQLVLPVLSWAFLEPILLQGHFDGAMTLGMILYPGHLGLWFLVTLFVYSISFSWMEWMKQKYKWRLLYGFLVVFIVLYSMKFTVGLLFCFTLSAYNLIYFTLGYYSKYHGKLLNINTLILGGGFIILYILRVLDVEALIPGAASYVLYIVHSYLMGIVGSLFFLQLGKKYLDKPNLWIQKLGKCTLGIYVVHSFLVYHLSVITAPLLDKGFSPYTLVLIRTIVALSISYPLVLGIRKVKYLRTLLIGE